MFFVLCINLYLTRITLAILGEEDFGINNIIGGIIVIFAIVTMPFSSTLQRFYNVEFTKNEIDPEKVFSSALRIIFLISFFLLFLYETIGLYAVNNIIVIPNNRRDIIQVVYQVVAITSLIRFLILPFQTFLNSKENMGIGAILEIILSIYKLIMIMIIPFLPLDKLIAYTLILFLGYLLMFFSFVGYCKKNYQEINFSISGDTQLCKRMLSFSAWNMIEAVSGIFITYGSNIILNLFGGVLYNTVYGITKQISSTVQQCTTNILSAVDPQITASNERKDNEYRDYLVCTAIKFSLLLIGFACIVFQFDGFYFLTLWLKNVPDNTFPFVQIALITAIFTCILLPLRTLILAIGRIKVFFLLYGGTGIISVILMYFLLQQGASQLWVMHILLISSIAFVSEALICIKNNSAFSWMLFLNSLIRPLIVLALVFATYSILHYIFIINWISILASLFISSTVLIVLSYFLLLSKNEKLAVTRFVKKYTKV
jgi:O-antigen/teichoic acid export membrane protein